MKHIQGDFSCESAGEFDGATCCGDTSSGNDSDDMVFMEAHDLVLDDHATHANPYRDFAFTLIVMTARELDIEYKRDKNRENREGIIYWFKGGLTPLPFALCCALVWGEDVCPRTIGQKLIENPRLAGAMEVPKPPESYVRMFPPASAVSHRQSMKDMGLIDDVGDIAAH